MKKRVLLDDECQQNSTVSFAVATPLRRSPRKSPARVQQSSTSSNTGKSGLSKSISKKGDGGVNFKEMSTKRKFRFLNLVIFLMLSFNKFEVFWKTIFKKDYKVQRYNISPTFISEK